jgi:hypothetical protein
MINYTGLRKRPTFEAIVDYLANGQEKTKFPNRLAKIIRNHPYLTQLDHIGMWEMEEQQENAWKEKEKEHRVKELSSKGTQSAPEARTEMRRETGATSSTQYFDLGKQDTEMTEEMDDVIQEGVKRGRDAEQSRNKRMARTVEVAKSHLEYVPENLHFAHFKASAAAPSAAAPSARPPRSRSPPPKKNEPEDMPSAEAKRVLGTGNSSSNQAPKRQQVPPSLPPPPPPKKREASEQARAPKKERAGPPPEAPPEAPVRAARVKKVPIVKQKHGTTVDNNTSREYWMKKSKGYIMDQLSHRGLRNNVRGIAKMNKTRLIDLLLA